MYPLGVNSLNRMWKFPIIFDIRTELHYKGLSDRLMSEGKISRPLNVLPVFDTELPWKTTEDKLYTQYTKIENDIPYRKLPAEKTLKLTESYEWRQYTKPELTWLNLTENKETFIPFIDVASIPNKISKYWVRRSFGETNDTTLFHPDYNLVNNGNYKDIRIIGIDKYDGLMGAYDAASIKTSRFEIFNKLPELELPIVIQFSKLNRSFEHWEHYETRDNGEIRYFKFHVEYVESKHRFESGTRPFFINLGRHLGTEDFATGALKYKYLGYGNTRDTQTVPNHQAELMNSGITYFPIRNNNNQDWTPKGTIQYYTDHTIGPIYDMLAKRFVYEFIFPREYGLKGIKFHDILHDYKIDSFTKPTGKGTVTYDRFRVKLAYPVDSKIEITKEPTTWAFNGAKIRLKSRSGWLNSGGDNWGNSPVAEGGDVLSPLPSGMQLISAGRAISRNVGTDKWLGYYFSFNWPFSDKVGIRLSQKPKETLLRENVADPNFAIDISISKLTTGNLGEKVVYIFIKDYNPASVARASTHRNAKNRWSIYINSIEFELELYLK